MQCMKLSDFLQFAYTIYYKIKICLFHHKWNTVNIKEKRQARRLDIVVWWKLTIGRPTALNWVKLVMQMAGLFMFVCIYAYVYIFICKYINI